MEGYSKILTEYAQAQNLVSMRYSQEVKFDKKVLLTGFVLPVQIYLHVSNYKLFVCYGYAAYSFCKPPYSLAYPR